jgi:3-deoxy-manno-octulosonate cytidylyltransferase (CMP-KDO synthetase)
MTVIGVLPARMAASRFPGKVLAPMLGMPMIGHCYHRTRLAPGIDAAYVATCDAEIAEYTASIGGTAIMTSRAHTRATTRTAEAVDTIERETGQSVDIVVMVQADEPLIAPHIIGATVPHFADASVDIVNVMSRLRTPEACADHNNVKVVVDKHHNALYFSREPIPSLWKGWSDVPRYMQTGIIAFRRTVLREFNAMAETMLEQVESVDMNRVVENGGRIRMVLTDAVTIGVDVPDELRDAEALLRNDPELARYLPR